VNEGLDRFAEPLLRVAVALVLVLLAVSVHAAGQAWMALRRGDPTAASAGRVSLWPLAHFDWIGCVFLPAVLVLSPAPGGLILGYGRPVPVDPGGLKRPKADFSLVAVAGPAANLLLALGLAFLGALLFQGLKLESPAAALLLGAAIHINVILACVQLLPLPGFDGLKALYAFLPDEWCWHLQRGERYFLLVLAMAVFFHALDWALYPGLQLSRWLCTAAGVPLPAL
jgi:Zn-dependent protease